MLTYRDAEKELTEILRERVPENVEESLTTMSEALVRTTLETKPERIAIGSWARLNAALGGGLREREFTILCGPTGAGKTTLLANIAAQLVANLTPVFIASVEVGIEDFVRKMVSVVTGESLAYGSDLKTVVAKMGKPFITKNTVFTNYESRVKHRQILCDMLYAHRVKGTKVAVIDNLNFMMEVTKAQDQIIAMDTAVHEFVVFCKKVPIHVIMVMHPRKVEAGSGRIESENDIKGSSTAVQESSNVILYNRLADMSDAPLGVSPGLCRELKFAKVRRNGRAVGSKIILQLVGESEAYRECRTM